MFPGSEPTTGPSGRVPVATEFHVNMDCRMRGLSPVPQLPGESRASVAVAVRPTEQKRFTGVGSSGICQRKA